MRKSCTNPEHCATNVQHVATDRERTLRDNMFPKSQDGPVVCAFIAAASASAHSLAPICLKTPSVTMMCAKMAPYKRVAPQNSGSLGKGRDQGKSEHFYSKAELGNLIAELNTREHAS